MKCPQCSYNQKHKEGMRCRCGYRFILDPKSNLRMSDGKFLNLVHKASGHGTRYYTEGQLYFHFCRGLKRDIRASQIIWVVVFFISFFIGLHFYINKENLLALFIPFLFLLPILFMVFSDPPSFLMFRSSTVTRWLEAGGQLPKLITEPQLHTAPQTSSFKDVYDYGVERILIVDEDLLVDLLVLNEWHAKEKTLVVSQTGYPSYIYQRAQELLKQRADLPVFLMHAPTEDGSKMERRLFHTKKFHLQGHPVKDLGYSTKDLPNMRFLRIFPRKARSQISLDQLEYGNLAVSASSAIAAGVVFSDLLDEQTVQALGLGISADFG